jgi:hypothetical protein
MDSFSSLIKRSDRVSPQESPGTPNLAFFSTLVEKGGSAPWR